MTLLLLAALTFAPAADAEGKFRDVQIDRPYSTYLTAQSLLMEVAGAKVIRLKNGHQIVLGVGSVVLKDDQPKTRLDAEKVCKVKALASVVGERDGVQVAHEEKAEEKTVIVVDKGKESARSVEQVLSVTRTQVQGIVRGMSVVGRWRSADGKILYLAMGMICDNKGEPVPQDD